MTSDSFHSHAVRFDSQAGRLGQKGNGKKDEKSQKNQLTETSIFDTMIKHLSYRRMLRRMGSAQRQASKEAEKKSKKRVDKEPRK